MDWIYILKLQFFLLRSLPCVERREYEYYTHSIEDDKACKNIPLKQGVMLFQVFTVPFGALEEKENMVDLSVTVSVFGLLTIGFLFLERKPPTEIK